MPFADFAQQSGGLLYGEPGEEEAVGLDVFPIRDGAAGDFAAVAAQQVLEFPAGEPLFPLGSFQFAPLIGVLVDDGDPAAGLDDATNFSDRFFDFHGVLERFGGVSAVEEIVGEGELGHRSGAGMDAFGDEAEHSFRDVEAPEFGLRLLLVEDAGEAALAATYVEDALAGERAEVLADELDVVNARVDGGGEMLLIGGGPVEGRLNARAQLGSELRAFLCGEEALPIQALPFQSQARVRKMGRPTLRS